MKQHEFPCFALVQHLFEYALLYYKNEHHYFIVEVGDYQPMAERGLRDSYMIRVPFYDEAKS